MDLQRYKIVFIIVVLLAALLVATPVLERILVYPSAQSASFSELYLLGPSQTAENYPYNITLNENYTVYLGVSNQLGSCAYYQLEIKFCNLTQQAPNSFNATSSPQPSLYTMNLFVPNTGSLQVPISFSLNYSYNPALSQVNFNQLVLNGLPLSLQGYSTAWNSHRNDFYGNLIFELWIYNGAAGAFEYNDRYVSLLLNLTA